MNKGKLVIVTGPSASGKTTVSRTVLGKEVASVTTRQPRAGEVNGVDYEFLTVSEFNQVVAAGDLAEYLEYKGNFYGVKKSSIEHDLRTLGYALVIATVEGMKQLEEIYPDCVRVFLYASKEDVFENISARGDDPETIHKRIATYEQELKNGRNEYDYVIKNKRGQFEKTCEIFRSVMESEGITVHQEANK